MSHRLAVFLVAAVACAPWAQPSRAHAQDDGRRQAALVLRILSYDRALPERAHGQVTILVAYRGGDAASEGERRRLSDALNALGRQITVSGMHARAVAVEYTNRAALAQRAASEHASALYVCAGLDASLADLMASSRAAHLLSLTSNAESVRHGLGVAMVAQGTSVQLVINLAAVEAEGARLDAAVLRLAQVIR